MLQAMAVAQLKRVLPGIEGGGSAVVFNTTLLFQCFHL